jgi:hypothetical protein
MRKPRPAPPADQERWPIHFVARDLASKRHTLRKGQPWPSQVKADIRMWASVFHESDRKPWSEFTFVVTLLVPVGHVDAILAKGYSLDEARAYLREQGVDA